MSRKARKPAVNAPAAAPAPPAAPPAAASNVWLQAAGAALFVLLALYLVFPDKVYVFDGIMFSGVIERAVDEWRSQLFNSRHLLFNPTLMLLRDGLKAVGLTVSGYALIQRVNAVVGAAGVFVGFALARRLTKDAALSAVCAATLAVSMTYWCRATEGQVYMLMTFWALVCGWLAVRLLDEPSAAGAAWLCAAAVAAVLFHAANVVLAPMILYALWQAGREPGRRGLRWAAGAAALGVAVPYVLTFHIDSLSAFIGQATGLDLSGGSSLSSLAGTLLSAGGASGTGRLALMAGELGASALSLPAPAAPWLGAALALAFGAAAVVALRRERARPYAVLLLAWALAGVVFESVWLGGDFFWASPLAALLALSALAAAPALSASPRRKPVLIAAAALAAVVAAWNGWTGIIPRSRLENNVGYQRTLFVRDHTVPSAWVITSGFGYPNAKVYLPYFARRSREVLEYYLDRNPKDKALQLFTAFIQRNVNDGVPIYLLNDMVDDPASLNALSKSFGVGPDDIHRCFGSGGLLPVARDGAFAVYLFVPDRAGDRLFTALSYSVLTEDDMPRLKMTAAVLRAVGGSLAKPQKRSAVALLKSTDFGFDLLEKGFGFYMNSDNVKTIASRRALFAQFQKTAEFHLRAGNVFRYVDDTADAAAQWREAYKLSGDAQVLRNIQKLQSAH